MIGTDHPEGSPPTVNLLLAALTLGLSLVAITSGSTSLALAREGSSSLLQVLGHAFVQDQVAALVVSLGSLLVFGNAVEARLGSALHALLYVACAAGGALAWGLFASTPGHLGATAPALGLLAAYVVLYPRTAVSLPLPQVPVATRVRWLASAILAAGALVFGAGRLPGWVGALAVVAILVAGLHDVATRWNVRDAPVGGAAAWLGGAVPIAAPAWLVVPVLLLLFAACAGLGLVDGAAAGAGGALVGAALALALTCAGVARGTHDHPTLAEAVGVRPLPPRPEWRRRGRLAWDPSFPAPPPER